MGGKKTWERRLNVAKAKHRPKLKNWDRDRFATGRSADFHSCEVINDNPGSLTKLKIGRVNVRSCSAQNFVKYFEAPYKPCIITGIPTEEGWTATKSWTFDGIREKYKNRLFKVGEDDDGYKIKAKMKYFIDYLKKNSDDSPLYIFDSNYDEDSVSQSILHDYRVPSYFTDDLFSLVGERRRPPYRWFLMGPERSGSCVHLDPLGTSAWNTVIKGRKRWVLFPPDTPRRIVKGLEVLKKGEDDEAINYFVDLLPRIKERYGAEVQIMELIQEEGETIYVPGGWWHGVLNLTDTVAITQNFCSYSNFDAVWRQTRKGRKKMAVKWLEQLHEHHPTLGQRALQLNAKDGFAMYDKETAAAEKALKQQKKKDEEKAKKKAKKSSTATAHVASAVCSSSGPHGEQQNSDSTHNSSSAVKVSEIKDKSKKRKKDHSNDSTSSDQSEGRTTNDGESSSANSDSHSSGDHRNKRRKNCIA